MSAEIDELPASETDLDSNSEFEIFRKNLIVYAAVVVFLRWFMPAIVGFCFFGWVIPDYINKEESVLSIKASMMGLCALEKKL